jgi:hypothetical protein
MPLSFQKLPLASKKGDGQRRYSPVILPGVGG